MNNKNPFLMSYVVTVICLSLAYWWAGWQGLAIAVLLVIMEVSFSFDNAVVNATVLKHMNAIWQQRFLTWGILIAVFGMYYLFPILIVALASGHGVIEVTHMAVSDPDSYRASLMSAHVGISAFGGMFLMMVFLKFVFDEGKDLHWLGLMERKLAQIGKLESVEIIAALALLLVFDRFLPMEDRETALFAGMLGVVLYVASNSFTALFGGDEVSNAVTTGASGLMGFMYLQLLDASFSLVAVIGSFAISQDIVIIVLGLTVGAMFVRSLTVHLVRKGTLDQYVFLEHGAHWGIGALAFIMLYNISHHVPEIVTGLIGLVFIILSLVSSIRYKKRTAARQ